MPSKVTYLLGAGASSNAMPTVARFNDFLINMQEVLQSYRLTNVEIEAQPKNIYAHGVLIKLYNYLKKMIKELKNFSSIDSYARFLYFTENEQLQGLRAFIDFCFSYWVLSRGLDVRYDSFFSLLIKGEPKRPTLPDNLKIITWNYDLQIESCLSRYFEVKNLKELDRHVNIHPSSSESGAPFSTKFEVFKLNGSAGSYFMPDSTVIKNDFILDFLGDSSNNEKISDKRLIQLLTRYHFNSSSRKYGIPVISYSWEDTVVTKSTIELAMKSCSETEILVVVGYSFPLINREADEKIIRSMSKIGRVYIQDRQENIDFVVERFMPFLDYRVHKNMFPQNPFAKDETVGDKIFLRRDETVGDKIFLRRDENVFFVPQELITQ